MRLQTKVTAMLAATAVVMGGQVAWSGAQAAPTEDSGLRALTGDATAPPRISQEKGRLTFVGAPAGEEIANPKVTASTSVTDAARAHLARYSSAFGTSATSGLTQTGVTASASGQTVVRYAQEVGGLPVVASGVTVNLRADRQLGSMLATISSARSVPAAKVTEKAAIAGLRAHTERLGLSDGYTVTSQGRQVLDPELLGLSTPFGARGVWTVTASKGVDEKRQLFVDDQTGKVLLNLDALQQATNRVVCDLDNTGGEPEPACVSDFDRVEGGPATGQADVDAAYDNAGEVSSFYQDVLGVDLTSVIGLADTTGTKHLASTVRYCPDPGDPTSCPYGNAFWNGSQMYYGEGFAVADDVVGHEMTHGVVDRNSSLFYFGQSGAINESIADIMGEVIDHRNGADDDSGWELAEGLTGIGPIRDMKDPTAFNDPDKMTSPNYWNDLNQAYWGAYGPYPDNGGVHFNSGVGNKTAYLISQGGTFNGQTIVGIDGADTGLTKTARLYYDAIVSMTSGSDYANLADVLEQGCADFVTAGNAGFTAADCANVQKAITATELRVSPPKAPQPTDAAAECPTGTTLRELFNSETGAPASKFAGDAASWAYGIDADWGSNATSGLTSWFGKDPETAVAKPLTATEAVALPAGQKSFMRFQQWRLFDWAPDVADPEYYDGGQVTVNVDGTSRSTDALPWVNGPTTRLWSSTTTPANTPFGGELAFAGDSFGWVASRVDLSSLAGFSVKPEFTVKGDASESFLGWFLDDITVYTCDAVVVPPVVTKAASTTVAKVKAKQGLVVLKAKVTAKAGAAVKGRVTFLLQGKKKVVRSLKLRKGVAKVVLKGRPLVKLGKDQGKGKRKIKVRVTYKGSTTVLKSSDKVFFKLR